MVKVSRRAAGEWRARRSIAAGTSQYGMQTFDQSLYLLYKNGLITLEEALDLVEKGSTFEEVIQLAKAIESAGATRTTSNVQLSGSTRTKEVQGSPSGPRVASRLSPWEATAILTEGG